MATTAITRSPFRSYDEATRVEAADKIIAKRKREIASLEKKFAAEKTTKGQRHLLYRLQASKHNLQSWLDYLNEGAPRVAGATIIP